MSDPSRIAVVIPALNEEASIGRVLADLPDGLIQVIVADNGSSDGTAAVARRGGARVVDAPRRGYGSACLAGIAALDDDIDVVVFLDADYSDHPDELPRIVAPVLDGRADLVIGSRALGNAQPGSMLPQQRFGNWLSTRLIRLLFGYRYTDLGPFRAVRRSALDRLGMRDPTYGWTVEMQVRALQEGLAVTEVPVSYRRRIGRSKIAGTVRGTLAAGVKIISTVVLLRMRGGAGSGQRPLSDQS
jgi:glycosyltransferase involved in cell wall biosynthesis